MKQSFGKSLVSHTDLKKAAHPHVAGYWPVQLFFVREKEVVGKAHVVVLRVLVVPLDQVQSGLVAVPPSEEGLWRPLVPRDSSTLLGPHDGQRNPVEMVDGRISEHIGGIEKPGGVGVEGEASI